MVRPLKRITFVRRRSSIPADEFGDAWCAAVAGALESGAGERHRLALCPVRPGGLYDGVAIEWGSDAGRWLSPPGLVDPDSTVSVLVHERAVNGEDWLQDRWEAGSSQPVPVLIGCIEPRPGLSRIAFRDYWWEQHRPLANRLVPTDLNPVAYVHNYVAPGQPGPWAGIGELYERSLRTAHERGNWFASPAAGPLVEDEDRFLRRDTRLVLVAQHRVLIT